MTREEIIECLGDDEEVLFLDGDGFDRAIVGIVERFGGIRAVCYDYERVIRALKKQGMTDEDAREYFEFNIIGAFVGDHTPVFLTRP